MVTIEELKKSIVEERKKVKKSQKIDTARIEKIRLRKELFQLKQRKLIIASAKGRRLLKRAGKGLLKAGRAAAPIVKKQVKLIREQQLRDEAIERRLSKRSKIKSIKIPRKKKSKKVKSKKKSRTIRIEF